MRLIIVDNDINSQNMFSQCAKNTIGINLIKTFTSFDDAMSFFKTSPADAAVLCCESMECIDFGRELLEINPSTVLIFISSSDAFAMDAFTLNAAAYLLKPINPDAAADALSRAKLLARPCRSRVFVRTFGTFDVFINGKPMKFSRRKSKEILAYLINLNGGTATIADIITDLWEDKPLDASARSSFQTAFKDLKKNLRDVGLSDIIISTRNQKSVNKSLIKCDYYDFLAGKSSAIEAFRYKYMSEYAWAEETCAYCTYIKDKYEKRHTDMG